MKHPHPCLIFNIIIDTATLTPFATVLPAKVPIQFLFLSYVGMDISMLVNPAKYVDILLRISMKVIATFVIYRF